MDNDEKRIYWEGRQLEIGKIVTYTYDAIGIRSKFFNEDGTALTGEALEAYKASAANRALGTLAAKENIVNYPYDPSGQRVMTAGEVEPVLGDEATLADNVSSPEDEEDEEE